MTTVNSRKYFGSRNRSIKKGSKLADYDDKDLELEALKFTHNVMILMTRVQLITSHYCCSELIAVIHQFSPLKMLTLLP